MIQASTWYMLAETSGSARGDFLVSFGGYSVCVRAIVAYNSSSLYILSNNISANTLISFRIRKLASKQYVDIKANKELDIAYSIDNNNNWTALFGLSGVGQEICALNNINGDYSETGTVDYEDLLNKPSINGVTLIGDKKASDLNLQPAGDYADKQFETLFKKFFEYDEFHNAIKARLDFYTDTDKNISAGGFNNSISEIVVISSYSELKDKPFINGQELISGDNSLDKLGIQPKGNYTTNEFVESLTNAIIEKLNLHIKDFEDFIAKLNTYFEFDSEHQAIKVLLDLYTVTGKNISAGGYNNSGTEIIVPKSYNELTEKPQINGQELLSGNNTLDKLGIQPKGNYVTNEIVESQISAIIEKLNSHITDFETFVNELNTYFKFEPDKQAIKVLYDLYTDTGKNISAGGLGGSGSSSLGALYQLVDVMINSTGDGVEGAVEGSVLAYDATAGKWKAIAQSEILPDMSGYYTKDETDAAINAIPIYSMAKLSASEIANLSDGANVREAYRLKKGGNNVDDTVIKIYKDSAIKSLELRDNKYLVLTYTDNEGNEQSISKDLSVIVNDNYVDLINNQEIGGIKTFTEKTIFKKDINVFGDAVVGGEVAAIVGDGTPAGVTDYSALTGKPSINGKELASGDNTLEALGIQPKGDYTTASQLATTLENYATKVFVSNNYASKSTVNAIQALIPATASADNQLADKDFVNSSIATATAEFRGSFTSLDELKATSGNLNDYAFYLHNDDVGNKVVDRYKWTTAGWLYEYTLNNSSFTAEQWAALNSAITATLVQSYNSHLNNTTIHITAAERTAWNNKWDYNEETIKGVKVNAAVLSDKATKLATARKIWGKPFDGSADVSGDLINVGNITASGKATIQGDIVCGGEVVAIAGEGTPAGVTDYSALTGKPSINGVTLVSGNNTLAALGIQAAGDYATNSGVTTLLANYADKTFVSNNYVGKSAFNNHTADTDIHITAAERSAWNAKWDYNEATIKAVKVNSASSADSVAWSGIKDKPTTFTPSAHTHTASEVSGLPTSLKNPYAVEIKANGVSLGTYDGSAAATFNLSAANVGAANKVHTHTASEISGLPTKLSAFTNDVGYITGITKSMVEGVLIGDITSHTHTFASLTSKPTTIAGYGITDKVAYRETWNNFMHNGNEFTFAFPAYSGYIWINYRTSSGAVDGAITEYRFAKGDGVSYANIRAAKYIINNGTSSQFLKADGSLDSNTYLNTTNYNSYAPTLTGTGASGTWGINISGNAATATNADTLDDLHAADFAKVKKHIVSGTDVNSIGYGVTDNGNMYYGPMATFGTADYFIEIQSPYNKPELYYRQYNTNGYSDKKQFAFTDSNVASATKLKTPRTIWGQSFDGSADVNGKATFTFDDGQKIIIEKNAGGSNYCGISFFYSGGFKVGGITASTLLLNPAYGGNVLIGTTTDNGYKLQVNGSERVYGDLIVDGEVSALVA